MFHLTEQPAGYKFGSIVRATAGKGIGDIPDCFQSNRDPGRLGTERIRDVPVFLLAGAANPAAFPVHHANEGSKYGSQRSRD